MLLGLASSPGVFNAVIISALSNIYSQNVTSYLDDIFVSVYDSNEMRKIFKICFSKNARNRSEILTAQGGIHSKTDFCTEPCDF